MSLNKLESWLTETPKHLVAALFSLAAAGIVLVIVILFVVSPQIAAIPNDPDAKAGPQPKSTKTGSSQLLVEVSGKTYRNNSTLNMGILDAPSATPAEGTKPADNGAPLPEPPKIDPQAQLNLDGVSDLTYPSSLTSVDTDTEAEVPTPSKTSKWAKKTPTKSPKSNQVKAGDPVNFAGLKAFFADLKNGDFTTMQRACWTITPEVFTDRFTTQPAQYALVEALGTAPEKTEVGLKWSGKFVEVSVSWSELSTRYSCPVLAYGGELDAVSVPDVTYVMERLLARNSYPLSPSDSEDNYPLLCSEWSPPADFTEFSPRASEKLTLDEKGLIDDATFATLQKILESDIKLYTVKNEYPMYLRASESQLKEPSAYFFRDKDGSLCIGSVVEKR